MLPSPRRRLTWNRPFPNDSRFLVVAVRGSVLMAQNHLDGPSIRHRLRLVLPDPENAALCTAHMAIGRGFATEYAAPARRNPRCQKPSFATRSVLRLAATAVSCPRYVRTTLRPSRSARCAIATH